MSQRDPQAWTTPTVVKPLILSAPRNKEADWLSSLGTYKPTSILLCAFHIFQLAIVVTGIELHEIAVQMLL